MIIRPTNAQHIKGKVHPFTGTEALYRPYDPRGGGYRYSSTLSWPTALKGGEGSASRPGRSLPLGKTQHPLYRLGGPQDQSGQVWKISPPTGIQSPDRPARSQSLYQLHYLAHMHNIYNWQYFIYRKHPIMFRCLCTIFRQSYPSILLKLQKSLRFQTR
jgi:hypothetical protein